MDFSKLSSNDRMALAAGVIVAVTGLISVANNWGLIMVVSLLAGVAGAYIVLQPQVAPAMKLPASKGILLLGAGAVATIATGLTAVDWMGYILGNLLTFDTIQFVVGLIAAIVLLYAGWMAYSGERGTTASSAPAAPPPPAA